MLLLATLFSLKSNLDVNISCRLNQKTKSSASKFKFRQANNCCNGALKAAKLVHVTKTKELRHRFPKTLFT